MARPIRQALVPTAAVAGSPIILNTLGTSPFNVSVEVRLSAGANMTYNVEYTYDDVFASNYVPSSGNWIVLSSMSAKIATADANLSAPVAAIRTNVTAWTSGTLVTTVIQAQQ
jgi:hypothetical protein